MICKIRFFFGLRDLFFLPAEPAVPGVPGVPGVPAVPGLPEVPAEEKINIIVNKIYLYKNGKK